MGACVKLRGVVGACLKRPVGAPVGADHNHDGLNTSVTFGGIDGVSNERGVTNILFRHYACALRRSRAFFLRQC